MFQSRYITAILMILIAAFSRILPHPPNFSPLLAISLFSGVYLVDRRLSFLVPLLAMFVSDIFLGFHSLMPVIYGLMALFVFFGSRFSGSMNLAKSIGLASISSVLFFIITNFAVWLTSGLYNFDLNGLVTCYTMAIPFFQNSLFGDLLYSGILFGSMIFLERNVFQITKPAPAHR